MSTKQNIPQEKLIEYFTNIAEYLGRARQSDASEAGDQEQGQAGYSLLWYYENFINRDLDKNQPRTYSPLLDAYLGSRIKAVSKPVPIDSEDIKRENGLLDSRFPDSAYNLNEQQKTAVHKALHYPLSIIKGPPGTGKTETILRIAALAIARGETVAAVSTNFSAVKNIEDKLNAILDKHREELATPDFKAICEENCALNAAVKHASLGNSGRRKTVIDPLTGKRFEFGADKVHGIAGWEQNLAFSDFTGSFPFITCTIHSLKKCFVDGAESKYDLLIMDEASQSNHIVGIVALSCAKRIVIVGDEEQLPPVLTEDAQEKAARFAASLGVSESASPSFSPYSFSVRNASFLQSCYEIFAPNETDDPSSLKTMLTEHHRCHPTIIQFCNQYIYGNRLEIKTDIEDADTNPFPLSILWYEGDYRERIQLQQDPRENDGATVRSSFVNRKQLAILRTEEREHLESLILRKRSICILSPFRGQIALVKAYLQELLDEIGSAGTEEIIAVERIGDGESESDSSDKMCALTIHKSQGQEFDIVYLLPVEDGNWEWPWSQGKRLINVAVSRAKHELRVILSTKLMSDEAQQALAKRQVAVVKPARDEDDENDEQMYVRKLIDYARETYAGLGARDRAGLRPEFGIRRSCIVSIFDEVPFKQSPEKDSRDYAPEACIEDALAASTLECLCFERNVTFDQILIGDDREKLADRCDGFYACPSQAHFDFVIFDPITGQLILAIEVDGAYHRYSRKATGRRSVGGYDAMKDGIMRDVCNASLAWLGPIRDGSFGRRAYPDGRLEGQRCSKEDEPSTNSSTGNEEVAPITELDWHCIPDDLSADSSSFVFLRIPSDGSTYGETDALASSLRSPLSSSSLVPPPTIEDYIRRQLSLNKNGGNSRVFVSEAVRQGDGPIPISKCLEAWKQKPALQQKLKTVDAQHMNKCLLRAGYHYLEDENPSMRKPTEKGAEIGIESKAGKGENGAYVFPVYTQAAQSHILQNLDSILEHGSDRVG